MSAHANRLPQSPQRCHMRSNPDMSPEAYGHLTAFVRALGLSIVEGSLTFHFANGDVRKVEAKTFHAVGLASPHGEAYSERGLKT